MTFYKKNPNSIAKSDASTRPNKFCRAKLARARNFLAKKYPYSFARSVRAGFTLIESLIALSIIMLVVMAATQTAASSLGVIEHIKDRVTAAYLAQDAFEYVRNIRDTRGQACLNDITGSLCDPFTWQTVLDQCQNGCRVDTTIPAEFNGTDVDAGIYGCGGPCEEQGALMNAISGGKVVGYGYNVANTTISADYWAPGKFKRIITIIPTGTNSSEILVTTEIIWTPRGRGEQRYRLDGTLLNWQVQ